MRKGLHPRVLRRAEVSKQERCRFAAGTAVGSDRAVRLHAPDSRPERGAADKLRDQSEGAPCRVQAADDACGSDAERYARPGACLVRVDAPDMLQALFL